MTLKRFIVNNINKKIDFDGKYDCQCVDLYRQYLKDVLEVPQTPSVEGAKDIYYKPGTLNKTTNSYGPGDILIYDATHTNPFGHVCILVSVLDSDTFIVFEQDGFKKDGAKLTVRTKENLIGGLYK